MTARSGSASRVATSPCTAASSRRLRSSETQRLAQATEVNDFGAQLEEVDRRANVVVLGDLNDFQFSPAVRELTSGHRL